MADLKNDVRMRMRVVDILRSQDDDDDDGRESGDGKERPRFMWRQIVLVRAAATEIARWI